MAECCLRRWLVSHGSGLARTRKANLACAVCAQVSRILVRSIINFLICCGRTVSSLWFMQGDDGMFKKTRPQRSSVCLVYAKTPAR